MKAAQFIDLHTHGLGGFDTRTESPMDIIGLAEGHRRAGVQAVLPTIYAAPMEEMRKNMAAVREAMEMQGGEGILGVNLEGPFLNPLKCGALDKHSFLKPSANALRRLLGGFEGIVKVITIAPELPEALKLIEKCAGAGIRVNMGHSDATFEEALKGKRAGATGITHLFNAMRPFHHREPGLCGLGLIDPDLFVEVIADGIHLHAGTLRLVFGIKNKDRIIVVSDSIKGPAYKKGVLQGSNMTLPAEVEFLRQIGIGEKDILRSASENPRKYLKGAG